MGMVNSVLPAVRRPQEKLGPAIGRPQRGQYLEMGTSVRSANGAHRRSWGQPLGAHRGDNIWGWKNDGLMGMGSSEQQTVIDVGMGCIIIPETDLVRPLTEKGLQFISPYLLSPPVC